MLLYYFDNFKHASITCNIDTQEATVIDAIKRENPKANCIKLGPNMLFEPTITSSASKISMLILFRTKKSNFLKILSKVDLGFFHGTPSSAYNKCMQVRQTAN